MEVIAPLMVMAYAFTGNTNPPLRKYVLSSSILGPFLTSRARKQDGFQLYKMGTKENALPYDEMNPKAQWRARLRILAFMNHMGVKQWTVGPQPRASKREVAAEREYVARREQRWLGDHLLIIYLMKEMEFDGVAPAPHA